MSVETTFTLNDRMSAALNNIADRLDAMTSASERADAALESNARAQDRAAQSSSQAQARIVEGLNITSQARERLLRTADVAARRTAMAQAREADAQRQLAESTRQHAMAEESANRRRSAANDSVTRAQHRLATAREAEAEAIRRVSTAASQGADVQLRANQMLLQSRRGVQASLDAERRARQQAASETTAANAAQERSLARLQRAQADLANASQRTATTEQAAANVISRARQRALADTARERDEQRRVTEEISRSEQAQRRLNGEINNGGNAISAMGQRLLGLVAVIASFSTLKELASSFVQMSDTVSNTTARINLMNDGLQTTKAIQDDIFEAAQRSRTEYTVMSDIVAKLGLRASEAFANTGEVLQFAENLNKQFVIAGASTAEINSASLQLTQALGSGVLRGEELNAVFEAAPNVIKTIADHLDVNIGQIREMASNGEITANIVRDAMLKATDDINAQFEAMPKTFGQSMIQIKNSGIKALEPLFARFAEFVNSDAFNTLANAAIAAFNRIAVALDIVLQAFIWLSSVAAWVAGIIMDNWSAIAPVLVVVGAALAAITAILIAKYTWLGLVRVATLAWAAAQWVVNAAYLTNPITWVIIGIVAAIALVIYALLHWADATATVVGVVVGLFTALYAIIINVFIGIANAGIAAGEWIVNTWNLVVYGIQVMWYELSEFVLRVLDWIIEGVFLAAEGAINLWNQAIYIIQVAWYGFSQFVLKVIDWIVGATFDGAEFVLNLWNDATYNVQKGFYKMADMALGAIETLASGTAGVVDAMIGGIMKAVNRAVGMLNGLIKAANKIPKVNIPLIGELGGGGGGGVGAAISSLRGNLTAPTKAAAAALSRPDKLAGKGEMPTAPESASLARPGKLAGKSEMPTAPDQVSFDRFDYVNVLDAYDKGKDLGEAATNKVADGLQSLLDRIDGFTSPPNQDDNYGLGTADYGGGPGANAADGSGAGGKGAGGKGAGGKGAGGKGKNPTGGKLDSIGKIEDDIDISDEDLKMLTEYADRKNIQNFITLQPNVVFDGTVVREEADLKKIVGHIETVMADEIEKSAKGVYFA